MKPSYFIILVVLTLILSSFFSPSQQACRRTGIKGHVYLVTGNQMPSPDRPAAVPAGYKTRLYIYELTNMNQVSRDGESAFYKSISTELVKEVETDADGSFSIKLKPGIYSLFVKKGDRFYANLFDEKNNIYPVEVKKGKMTELDFQANYDAVY